MKQNISEAIFERFDGDVNVRNIFSKRYEFEFNNGIWEVELDESYDLSVLFEYIKYLQYKRHYNGDVDLYDEDDFFLCDCCEEICDISDRFAVGRYSDEYVCVDCLKEHYIQCEKCRCYEHKCDFHEVIVCTYGERRYWCTICANNHSSICDNCGVRVSDDIVLEIRGNYYCPDCAERRGMIRGYHDHPHILFHKCDEETPDFYIGTEIETQGKGQSSSTIDDRVDVTFNFGEKEKYIYQMYDGSLGDGGIECITQPMSKAFFDKFDFEDWFEALVDAGAVSHYCKINEDGHPECGLHVHISRTAFDKYEHSCSEIVGFMRAFIVENSFKFEEFARRRSGYYYNYFRINDYDISKNDIYKAKKGERKDKDKSSLIEKIKGKGRINRYTAVNDEHCYTVEFRIFRGTLNPETYRASVELCIRLIDYCGSVDFEEQTWEGFMTYKPVPEVMSKYMKRIGM